MYPLQNLGIFFPLDTSVETSYMSSARSFSRVMVFTSVIHGIYAEHECLSLCQGMPLALSVVTFEVLLLYVTGVVNFVVKYTAKKRLLTSYLLINFWQSDALLSLCFLDLKSGFGNAHI